MPCLANTPASFAPFQFNIKTLFWGMTAVTFSAVCASAGALATIGIRAVRQTSINLLFIIFPLVIYGVARSECRRSSCADDYYNSQ